MSTPPDQPPPGPLSAARTVALAASIVLLLAVVSIAARSGDHDRAYPGGSAAATTGHHALVWVLLVLGPIAGVLGLALFLYAHVMRRRDPDLIAALRKRSRLRRRIMLAAFVALIAYSVATDQNPAVVIMNLLHDLFGSFNVGNLNPFAPPAPPNQRGHPLQDGGGVSGVDWALVGVTWVVLVVAAGLLIRRFRRHRAAADDPSSARAEIEPADLGLERLRNERDPRRAVIGAYALMDRLMADRALGRRRSEAPLEYLGRMTAAGFARITALGRLTRLYARARFSTHPIDRAMQADAVDAVETIAAEGAE